MTAVVTDSLGVPLAGIAVRATSLADSAGFAALQYAVSNDTGAALFTLSDGPWACASSIETVPPRAAGATFVVPGGTRPATDTVLVRLTMLTASGVSGRRFLAGEVNHAETFVSIAETGTYTSTANDGSFQLGLLPPGRWTLVTWHDGFALGVTRFEVTLPGSAVVVADDSLRATSQPPRDPPHR